MKTAMRVTARDFKIGDVIKSWDFEPAGDRPDRFVIGEIVRITHDDRYKVKVMFDSTGAERTEVLTPMYLRIGNFKNRLSFWNGFTKADLLVDAELLLKKFIGSAEVADDATWRARHRLVDAIEELTYPEEV